MFTNVYVTQTFLENSKYILWAVDLYLSILSFALKTIFYQF